MILIEFCTTPRCVSARNHQAQSNIETLNALIRKHIFSFIDRCTNSQNIFFMLLMSSDLWYKRYYYQYFVLTLFLTYMDLFASEISK